jgi:AraC-like DNA-binding protein
MEVKLYIPRLELQGLIVSFITVDALLPEGIEETITPYPPTPHQSIIFYGDHPIQMQKVGHHQFNVQPAIVIIGPQYTRVNIKVTRRIKAVRADFHPSGLHRLLGLPMKELFDEGFDARDLLGNEMSQINEQLVNVDDLSMRKVIVEAYFFRKLNRLKDLTRFDFALRELVRSDGNLPIEQVASLACLSIRQLERKFNERIGIPPKVFARIARFSKAYRLRESRFDFTWSAIAQQAGYFDQMHLIRDFKEFAGVNPKVIDQALAETPFRMQADLRI